MFIIELSESAFYNSIEMSMYRNNFLDLQKNSLKQSFNFKKRVGESHVLLHNLHVELFKCKHKMAFAGGYRSLFFAETLQQCSLIYRKPVTPPAKKYKNLSNPYYDNIRLTKTTAAQNDDALSYHSVRGQCFQAVVFVATKINMSSF